MTILEQKPQYGVNYNEGFDGFTVRAKDFLANGIKWFERWDQLPGIPPVSHTLKIVGENKTIEALSDGVVYGTIDHYLNDPDCALLIREPIGWTPEMGRRMTAEAEKHLGEKYNWFLIAMIAISRTYFGRAIDNMSKGKISTWLQDWADNSRMEICSSLVARVDSTEPELAGKSVLSLPPFKVLPTMLFGDSVIYKPGAIELIP